MNELTHDSPCSPAAEGVYRRDAYLLAERGSDLSRCCWVCGKASVGEPIVRRLGAARWISRKSAGIYTGTILVAWDFIAMVLSLVGFVLDHPSRQQRVVKIGFCEEHRWKYVLCRKGGLAAGILGAVILVLLFFASNLSDGAQSVVLLFGMPLLMTGFFLPMGAPSLQLVGETKEGMWLRGAGLAFRQKFPEMPKGK